MLEFLNSFIVRIFLLVAVVFLQVHLWFSDSGFIQYQAVNKQIERAEMANQRAFEDNRKLENALEDLRRDGKLLENNARENLGMVGLGRLCFTFSRLSCRSTLQVFGWFLVPDFLMSFCGFAKSELGNRLR